MKAVFSTITIALLCLIATSQATDIFTGELKEDALFLTSDDNGDDDCYIFKLGEVEHRGKSEQKISSIDLREVLGTTPVIIAKSGCAAPVTVNPASMTITYSDGRIMNYPADQMYQIQENQGVAERFLYDAVSVLFTNISFTDEAGTTRALKDKMFKIN